MPLLYEGKRVGIWRHTGRGAWSLWISGLHIYWMPQMQIGPFQFWFRRKNGLARQDALDIEACCFRSFLP